MNKKNNIHSTVIIGSGIAGLSCARKLLTEGKSVIILEGNNRIGGRIKTQKHFCDFFDLGASWIHGIDKNPIWQLTQKHNINTKVCNYADAEFINENGILFPHLEKEKFRFYISKIEELAHRKRGRSALNTIYSAIEDLKKIDGEFSENHYFSKVANYFHLVANDPYATDLESLNSKYKEREGHFGGDEVIFPDGYIQLIESMSEGVDIILDTLVKEINHGGDLILINDERFNTYVASSVVVTVPLGILKKGTISFIPELEDSYQMAIDKIGFGSFNKIFIFLRNPLSLSNQQGRKNFYFWDGLECFNIMDLTEVYGNPVYLMLFGGERSERIDNYNYDEVKCLLEDILQRSFGPDVGVTHIIYTRWGKDPFSFGSFSFPSLDYNTYLVDSLNRPINDRVYFCGEHCSIDYPATVHGAYLSGYETAIKILNKS